MSRKILKYVLFVSILFELVLVVLVFTKVGFDRLPSQILRIFFQLILISVILIKKSNIALFLLTACHILTALYVFSSFSLEQVLEISIGIFHLIVGVSIYFNDWIESKLKL